MTVTMLRHARVDLALHELRAGTGRPLLLLHGLGESSPEKVPAIVEAWKGPVYALDFTGHGQSSMTVGGGYTPEVLMADVSTAIDHLGTATLLGRGLGGYVALLAAGARAADVGGTIICDGSGLLGAGPVPGSAVIVHVQAGAQTPPDPFALAELSQDVRPGDYATSFVRQATQLSPLAEPICVCATSRPPWLEAVAAEPGVRVTTLAGALALYGAE